MIILQKLKWSNCFSYGENNELDLNANILTQVIGTNGMGKSSIPLIIEEVLYNKNSKGIKKIDIPNRYINKGYDIYLSFTKDNRTYEITVTRKTNIKVVLLRDGEDISSHTSTNTYKTIQNILGVDFKTFSQLVYQNTNASLQFLTATDSNRKKFLIDLLQLEKYVELFEIFKTAHKEVSIQSNTASASLHTVTKWLENNKLEDTNILPMLDLTIDTSEDEKTLGYLTIELQNISEKNKKILQNNHYRKMLQSVNITELQKSVAHELEDYDPLVSEYGEQKGVAAGSERALKKIQALGQICPTCEQAISYNFKEAMIQKENEILAKSKERLNELKRRIESLKATHTKSFAAEKAIRDWENLYNLHDDALPDTVVDKKELECKLEAIQSLIQERKTKLASIAAENERRTKINTRIQVIQEQKLEFEKEITVLKKELSNTSTKESSLEVLKKAFSTNGLIAYKIETLVKELEILANQYLGELSDGRFTLEFVVTNDKLNVQITDNGRIVDILALSSGELARVNTATLVAIRKLMSSISSSKINILFLDEVINVLDDTGREKIVEVLLQEEDLNTYIVSHGWTHPLLEKIEVVKSGNVSVLE
jgi:DNA repair exonuclease SbcCD ATPase subunit